MSTIPRLLVTGPPGCGKTTVVLAAIDHLQAAGVEVHGFVTRERRGEDGRRYAFDIDALNGLSAQIANVNWSTGVQVGRYGVDVAAFEQVALPALRQAAQQGRGMIVIDEIGRMELNSTRFVGVLSELLDVPLPMLATVHSWSHPVTDALIARKDVEVLTVTEANRRRLPNRLVRRIRSGW